ncbi:TPA: hypothetical protein DCG61_00690 [Patescibacteria group bacterium]|jgi:hypothetical protein|nr:hypothetical protein [Patescibacteria group bacterium]
MNAQGKERIYEKLRDYHVNSFESALSTDKMDKLRVEFAVIEDATVAMLLGLVNGKSEYIDYTEDLKNIKKKSKISPKGNRDEDEDRKFFIEKIDSLEGILNQALDAKFLLRPSRADKAAKAKLEASK